MSITKTFIKRKVKVLKSSLHLHKNFHNLHRAQDGCFLQFSCYFFQILIFDMKLLKYDGNLFDIVPRAQTTIGTIW